MRQLTLRALVLVAAGALAGALNVGCGEEREEYVPPPPPAPSRAATPADDDEEETVEDRVAAMIEVNDRTTFGVETRDPFQQPRPTREGPIGRDDVVVGPDCDIDEEPLGKTSLEELELMGLITGTALPRAMFLSGGNPQAIIVTEGALAGPDCQNRLVDIRDNQVVFQQLTMNEAERVETIIELNDSRIGSRFISIDSL